MSDSPPPILPRSSKYRSITKSWAGSPVSFWPAPRRSKSFSIVDLEQLRSVESFVDRENSKSYSLSMFDAGDDVLLELTSLIESIHQDSR